MKKKTVKTNTLVTEALPEFVACLKDVLEEEGSEWKSRPRDGQEDKTWACYTTYWRDYDQSRIAIPWLKVAALALICWWREQKGNDLR